MEQPTTRIAPARNLVLDAMRFLAAIAIVWQHTPESDALKPLTAISTFAVPFFILSAMLLVFEVARRVPARPVGTYAWTRVLRIYVPFLLWSAIYLLAREGKHIFLKRDNVSIFHPGLLIAGTAHHLWFLPFILVVTVIGYALAKSIVANRAAIITASLIATIAGVVIGFMPIELFSGNFLFDRSWNMAPSILWGFAIGAMFPFLPTSLWRTAWLAPVGLLVAALCSAAAHTRFETIFSNNLAGVGMLMIALSVRYGDWPIVRRLAALGALSYGIYLSHVLFIEGMQAVAARKGIVGRPALDVGVFIFASVSSVAVAYVLSRWRWGRWLVP